jgi:hypothetical protein
MRNKKKDKILEFFSSYSHEILADAGDLIPGNLRNWFVLPYMEEPEKDPEFAMYFSEHIESMLRTTLHNFLSAVLASAPHPKLLILEKWFRSEAQQEMRSQLNQSRRTIECLVSKIESTNARLHILRSLIHDLVAYIDKSETPDITITTSTNDVGLLEDVDKVIDAEISVEAESKRAAKGKYVSHVLMPSSFSIFGHPKVGWWL